MRRNELNLVVVHEGGAKVRVAIDAAEYTKVLAHFDSCHDEGFSNLRYIGTSAGGMPYRLMLGTETLSLSLEGGRMTSSEAVYTVTIKHKKGGEAEVRVTKAEYEAIMKHFSDLDNFIGAHVGFDPYCGIDASAFEYRLRVPPDAPP